MPTYTHDATNGKTYATVGQNHVKEKICHRMHQPPAQGQGKPRTFKAQVFA